MRAVIQRVSRASVVVNQQTTGSIAAGVLIFLGVGREDVPKMLPGWSGALPSCGSSKTARGVCSVRCSTPVARRW